MTVLYRAFDRDDRLLYIGIADDFRTRLRDHVITNSAAWVPYAARMDRTPIPPRPEAFLIERVAIRLENPVFNRQGRTRVEWQAELEGYVGEDAAQLLCGSLTDLRWVNENRRNHVNSDEVTPADLKRWRVFYQLLQSADWKATMRSFRVTDTAWFGPKRNLGWGLEAHQLARMDRHRCVRDAQWGGHVLAWPGP